jgi:hypothetical protein
MSNDQEADKLFKSLWEELQANKIDRKEFLMRALGAGLSLAAVGGFLAKASAATGGTKDPLKEILSELPSGSTTTVPLEGGVPGPVAQTFSNWPNNGWGRRPPIWGNSDRALKHDIALLGRLDNGLGLYRFCYHGSDEAFVGVMAQEVQDVLPDAVERGSDGYLSVCYDMLGLRLQTYAEWLSSRKTTAQAGMA